MTAVRKGGLALPTTANTGQALGLRTTKRVKVALAALLTAALVISLGFGIYDLVRS
jgi:hypothetical protein